MFSPQIINFNRVFHYKPSILAIPLFLETPICSSHKLRFVFLAQTLYLYICIYIYVYSFLKSSSQLVGRMSSKSIIADATETWWTQNRLLKRQRKVSCSTYILYYIGDAPHIWYWWYRNTNCKIPLQNAALVVATCAGCFCCLLKLSGIALAETSDVNKNLLTLQGGFRWMFPKIVVPPNHPF